MIRYTSEKQLPLSGFETPFESSLNENNRWVKLAQIIPWDDFAEAYNTSFHETLGGPGKDARIVIGAVIIKHKLCLSDEETILQLQENRYLQYFVGLKVYPHEKVFVPSLFVEIRKRMGEAVFTIFEQSIITTLEAQKQTRSCNNDIDSDNDTGGTGYGTKIKSEVLVASKPHQGKIIVDATVAE